MVRAKFNFYILKFGWNLWNYSPTWCQNKLHVVSCSDCLWTITNISNVKYNWLSHLPLIGFKTEKLYRDTLVCQQKLWLIRLLLLIFGGFGDGVGTWIDAPLSLSMFHVHATWHPISLEKEILDPPSKQVLMITHNSKSDIFRPIKDNEESY